MLRQCQATIAHFTRNNLITTPFTIIITEKHSVSVVILKHTLCSFKHVHMYIMYDGKYLKIGKWQGVMCVKENQQTQQRKINQINLCAIWCLLRYHYYYHCVMKVAQLGRFLQDQRHIY